MPQGAPAIAEWLFDLLWCRMAITGEVFHLDGHRDLRTEGTSAYGALTLKA
jgi:hypothetical protein